jgi:hypothetical protein
MSVGKLEVTIPSAETKLTSGQLSTTDKLMKSRAFTAYAVTVNQTSVTWRRFSEFVDLHARLQSVFESEWKQFPPLPQKTWFHSEQFDEATIGKRRVALETYLQYLVNKGYVARSIDLAAFLGLDADGAAKQFKTSESSGTLSEIGGVSVDDNDNPNQNQTQNQSGEASIVDDDDDVDDVGEAWISSISESISMRSAVAAVFVGLNEQHRVFISPSIPLDKFKAAKNSVKMPDDERPVVLVDLSRRGLCHQALLLCTRGLYFNYEGLPGEVGRGSFTYPQLFRQRIFVADNDLHIGPTKLIYLKYAGVSAEALMAFLKNLKEYVRMKQLALKLNEDEPLRPYSPAVLSSTPAATSATTNSGALPGAAVMGQLSPRANTELALVLRAIRCLKARALGAEQEPEHDAIEATWQSVLYTAFGQFDESNSVYTRDVPSAKLQNALKSINLGNQQPIVLIDNTKHGSGYQSVIFASLGVYFHTDRVERGSGKVTWEELVSSPITQLDKHNLQVGDNYVINLAGAAIVPAQLLECLHLLTSILLGIGQRLAGIKP